MGKTISNRNLCVLTHKPLKWSASLIVAAQCVFVMLQANGQSMGFDLGLRLTPIYQLQTFQFAECLGFRFEVNDLVPWFEHINNNKKQKIQPSSTWILWNSNSWCFFFLHFERVIKYAAYGRSQAQLWHKPHWFTPMKLKVTLEFECARTNCNRRTNRSMQKHQIDRIRNQ